MAYGMARLMSERGREQALERKRYEEQLAMAEKARRIESERKGGWGTGLSLLGGAFLVPIGSVFGKALGQTIGERTKVHGRQAEDFKVGTDVGKFGVSQREELENVNRQLREADAADTARGYKDLGVSALGAFTMGGGDISDPSSWGDFSPTQFGGQAKGGGIGLFGKGDMGTSIWDQWLGQPKSLPGTSVPSSYIT